MKRVPLLFDLSELFTIMSNKHVIGQRVLTLPDRQGIEGLGEKRSGCPAACGGGE